MMAGKLFNILPEFVALAVVQLPVEHNLRAGLVLGRKYLHVQPHKNTKVMLRNTCTGLVAGRNTFFSKMYFYGQQFLITGD
ncbi:hypothetical protein SG34_032270 [Thalassomonas viridans]|uniref:Uncharacterized protein n=1 Tax=Thalassomonas viridans TaxID=137584 RepID=A0AAF0CB51_9GAMM|nr:hypothetical protein [Thalassomonas viridans]WDE09357.1 hypothetical protein SG34_032270 [Thalassomonas viridans]